MRKLIFSLIITMVFFSAANVHANLVDTFGIGSRAMALGGAYTANASDPFAGHYNPAGLTQIESMTVAFGTAIMAPNLKARNYTVQKNNEVIMGGPGVNVRDESDNLLVPHLGFAMPINSKWAFGISAYAPYGLHLKWDRTNTSANPTAFNSYESWYQRVAVTPAVAYKVNEKLSLGFGVVLGRSESGTYQNLYGLYQKGITGSSHGDLTDDLNYSFNFGVMYNPVEKITLGLAFRSKASADFSGDLKLKKLSDNEKKLINDTLYKAGFHDAHTNNNFKSKIRLEDVNHPAQVQAGIRYEPHKRVSFEADIVWTNWSDVKQQTVKIKDKYIQELLGTDEQVHPRDWVTTRQVRVGLEYLLTDMFTLRCGFFYDPTPVPDDTFDIVWPDADKKTYSVGLGVNLGSWTLDGTFVYISTEKDIIVGGESKNLNHTYGDNARVTADAEAKIFGYSMTASYKF